MARDHPRLVGRLAIRPSSGLRRNWSSSATGGRRPSRHDDAIGACHEAEERLREAVVIQEAQEARGVSGGRRGPCSCRRAERQFRYGDEWNSQGLHNRCGNDHETEEEHAGDRTLYGLR
jgi:hypothetical protein